MKNMVMRLIKGVGVVAVFAAAYVLLVSAGEYADTGTVTMSSMADIAVRGVLIGILALILCTIAGKLGRKYGAAKSGKEGTA